MSFIGICSEPVVHATNGTIRCYGQFSQFDMSNVLTSFDLSSLQPEVLAAAFGAGATLAITAEVVGIAVSHLLNFILKGR